MSENLRHILFKNKDQKNLFSEIQGPTMSGDDNGVEKLARQYGVGPANILGMSSFYDLTRKENQGVRAFICNGSACLLAGTQDALRNHIGEHLPAEQIGEMCCLGRCHENSAFHYNGRNFSGVDKEGVKRILDGEQSEGSDSFHSSSDLDMPVLMSDLRQIEDYKLLINKVLKLNKNQLLEELKTAMLRGRGGAGFPVWRKLDICMNTADPQKYIVCNADEGDPGSYSDRYLMEHLPHQILFGMYVSAYIIGAQKGIIYVRAEYPQSQHIIRKACEEWNQFLSEHLTSDFSFIFEMVTGAGSYVVGEETALLSSIEGQRPEVRVRPPYPVEAGLFGKPTLVNNVETFANMPYIIQHGGKAFSRLGTAFSTGTKLVSLDGHFRRPGVYEVLMGKPLLDIIMKNGQGFSRPVKALHIGGPLGGIVPSTHFDRLTMDFESFRKYGFELGHASIISIPDEFPMIRYLIHLFEFVADESCGKCFPCRLGSKRGADWLTASIREGRKVDKSLFNELLITLREGSLCAMGSGLTTPVKNILEHFDKEIDPYFS